MSQREWDEATVLRQAREGLSPTAADQLRLRQAIDAALLLPAAVAVAPKLTVPHALRPGSWASRLLLASTVALSAGSIGYWAGFRAGQRNSAVPVLQPAAVGVPERAQPAPVPALPSVAPILEPEPPLPEQPARAARTSSDSRTATAAKASVARTLAAEVRALRSIERALRDQQPALALALLQRLDHEQPDGKLMEEREATAAIARCALGQVPFGVELGGIFAERHPHSVYRARVEQVCAASHEQD